MNMQGCLFFSFLLTAIWTEAVFSQPGPLEAGRFQLQNKVVYERSIAAWFPGARGSAAPQQFSTLSEVRVRDSVRDEWHDLFIAGERQLLWSVPSRLGNYFAVVSQQSAGHTEKSMSIQVFSQQGRLQYEIAWNQHFDESHPLLLLSDSDGALMMGQAASGRISFYDNAGQPLHHEDLFPDAFYDLERILAGDIASDGQIILLAGKRGASPADAPVADPSAEPELLRYLPDGTLLWRRKLPENNAASVAISDDGEYIHAATYTVDMRGNVRKRSSLLARDGIEIASANILPKQQRFSPDSKFLLLAENQRVQLLSTQSGTKLWQQKIERKDGMVAAVSLADNAALAALFCASNTFSDGEFVFAQPHIKLLDAAGKLQDELIFADETAVNPAVQLNGAGTELFIGFRHAYYTYEARP